MSDPAGGLTTPVDCAWTRCVGSPLPSRRTRTPSPGSPSRCRSSRDRDLNATCMREREREYSPCSSGMIATISLMPGLLLPRSYLARLNAGLLPVDDVPVDVAPFASCARLVGDDQRIVNCGVFVPPPPGPTRVGGKVCNFSPLRSNVSKTHWICLRLHDSRATLEHGRDPRELRDRVCTVVRGDRARPGHDRRRRVVVERGHGRVREHIRDRRADHHACMDRQQFA